MDLVITAIAEIADPFRLLMLCLGIIFGLVIGVVPGLGGVFGLTLIIPMTYGLDPYAAFALLLGMGSVTTTSDTIPAVLLGVPGTVGAAATVIDGHELAKQGKAADALGAAYSASLLGGIFGALVLAASLPVMRKVAILLNYGDLLAVTIFGLTLVAMLSGSSRRRGLLMAALGVLISLIGLDPYEGAERWTFGQYYLWGGVPTAIFFLGIFAVPELAALLGRGQVVRDTASLEPGGLIRGIRASLREWPLILRSSALGSMLGAVPGVGVTVIEWIAYGSAAKRPGDGPEFGKGNIRGVIGPESANNAKEGGALVPTLAFGIPGSATMAILLGAFAIHGIVPGPKLLEQEAPLLVSMVLTVAAANIIGAGLCLGLTPSLAKLSLAPAKIVVPSTLIFVVLGAFYTNRDFLDLAFLAAFGTLGFVLKKVGWSRPALALGFVLGPNIERFFVLTHQISGWSWLGQPFVLVIFAFILANFLRHAKGWRTGRIERKELQATSASLMGGRLDRGVALLTGVTALAGMLLAIELPTAAKLFPMIAGSTALVLAAATIFQRKQAGSKESTVWHFELQILVMLLASGAAVLALGHILGAGLFLFFALLCFGEIGYRKSIAIAMIATSCAYVVFDVLGYTTWPKPALFYLI